MHSSLPPLPRPTKLLVTLALLLTATVAVAAHPFPADAAPITKSSTVGADSGVFRESTDVASSGTKSLVVYSKHSVNDRDHVWAVLMNADGGALSSPIRIDQRATNAFEPHVAWNGSSFLVVWTHDYNDKGTDLDIRGQLVTSSGALNGTEIPIETSLSLARWPAVTAGPNGTFEVVYNERTSSSALSASFVACPLSSGGGIGQKTTLRTAVGDAGSDVVWVNGAQQFVASYTAGGGRQSAVFDAAGTYLGGERLGDYFNPDYGWNNLAALATDGNRVLSVFPSISGAVNASWIDLQPIRHTEPVAIPHRYVTGLPDVAFNGVFLVVWDEQTGSNPVHTVLRGTRFKADGTSLDTTSSLISDIPDLELLPALSRGTSAAGSFTLAWQNGSPGHSNAVVFTAGVKAAPK